VVTARAVVPLLRGLRAFFAGRWMAAPISIGAGKSHRENGFFRRESASCNHMRKMFLDGGIMLNNGKNDWREGHFGKPTASCGYFFSACRPYTNMKFALIDIGLQKLQQCAACSLLPARIEVDWIPLIVIEID